MLHPMQIHLRKLLLVTCVAWIGLSQSFGQCDGNVPTLAVDLTSSPSATYLSPSIVRNGYCCGVSGNDRCIQFLITLHPDAQGINFNVCAGAVPPGALYYQIGCGPQTAVGTPICLNGPGPHVLTFCKPGNNNNQYCITSIPAPSAGPPIALNEGCVGTLTSSGFAAGTVQWTSIYPGAAGAYNNYLSCPTCAITNVTGQPGYPAYVDYQVCGFGISPCSAIAFCDTVRVNFYSTLSVNIVPQMPTVCYGATGTTITAIGAGGLPPYSFSWSNGLTTPGIYVGPGTYTVTMSDNSDCPPTTSTVVVTQFLQPIQALAGTDIVVCGGTNPSVQLSGSVTGVTTGVWISGAGQFNPSNTALNATYTPTQAEITNGFVDLILMTTNNGTCPGDQDTVRVYFDPGITTGVVTGVNALCNGTATGSATFTPYDPAFTYLWSDQQAQTTATATGLTAGNYSVTVTNAMGCSVTLPVTIGQPAALAIASMTVVNESCAGVGNGSVTANVTGGTPPYTYSWNVPGTGSTITGGAGTYTVTVSDANGCASIQASATIQSDGSPNVANAGADPIGCDGDAIPLQGTVTNATGGIWSGGNGTFMGTGLNVQYQPTAAEVLSGMVQLTLTTTGNTSCPPASDQVVVYLSNSFISAGLTSTNVSCNGDSNGTATFSPVSPGMSFQWQGYPAISGPVALGLPAGTHTVIATDGLGCTATFSTTITQPNALVIADMDVVNESCAGTGNGSVTATVIGGTAPYSYSWNVPGNGNSITGTTGNYTVTVTDANGCASIQASAPIAADGQPNLANAGADIIACEGDYPVALQGMVTNATGGFWSGGAGMYTGTGLNAQYTPTNAEVQAGSVILTLTTLGNSSCPPATDQVLLSFSNAFIFANVTSTDVSCANGSNGTLLFSPAIPGLTYQWQGMPSQTGPMLTGVSAGNYTVQVTDQLGCIESFTGTVMEPSQMTIVDQNTQPPSCNGSSDGQAWVLVEGGIPPFTYQWNSGSVSNPAIGLMAGTHTVTVLDSQGCVLQHPMVLIDPPALSLSAYVPDTVCVNVPVPLNAIAAGGTGAHQIQWAGIGSGPSVTYSFPASQVVMVSVTDANNCPGPILELPVSVLDLQNADLNTYGDTTVCPGGSSYVGAELDNYPGDYSIIWPQLGNTGNGPFLVPINSNMTLNVIVTDQCAQSINSTVQLQVETPPSITLPTMIGQGCTPLTVQFPNNLTNQPVSYSWQLGNGSSSNQPAPQVVYSSPGSYTISLTVTTPLGCTATAQNTGQVIAHASPSVSLTADPWITNIENSTVNFTGETTGNIIYNYWNFGDGGTSNLIDPSHTYTELGSYQVSLMVQDANGCVNVAEGLVEITPIYDIVVPNVFTPDLAGGGSGHYNPWDLSNDVFYPFVNYVEDYRMRIFNRWGELIFESNDLKRGWDGYYRDQLSPQDVYVYQLWVRFVDGMEKHQLGDIMLMR